eukprot:scaffold19179_cov41-Attheya_sp.AAC.1
MKSSSSSSIPTTLLEWTLFRLLEMSAETAVHLESKLSSNTCIRFFHSSVRCSEFVKRCTVSTDIGIPLKGKIQYDIISVRLCARHRAIVQSR